MMSPFLLQHLSLPITYTSSEKQTKYRKQLGPRKKMKETTTPETVD
jgi:hypothetical protein